MKTIITALLIFVISHSSFSDWVHMTNGMFAEATGYDYTIFQNKLIAAADYGRFYSTNNGDNWNWTDFNMLYVYSLGANETRLFAGTQQYGIKYTTTTTGANWVQTSYSSGLVRCLEVVGNTIFAGNDGTISVSRDNGETWNQVYGGSVIYSIKIKGNILFASTALNGVLKSTNKGYTWVPTGLTGINVYCLAVGGNKLYAGYLYGVLVSDDDGDTWTQTAINIPVNKLAANDDFVFAGGYETGVYVTTNSGLNWAPRNDNGLGTYTIRSMMIANDYIFIGTESNALYKRPLDDLTGVHNINSEIPKVYSLKQNYPNPFNPQTKISFDIPANSSGITSNVKLVIYDVLGNAVETLADEKLKPGKYEATWNASGYASGVYFYTLKTDNYSETKKMTLVK